MDMMERNAGHAAGHPRPAPRLCWSSCLLVLVPRRPGRARRRQRRLGPSSSATTSMADPALGSPRSRPQAQASLAVCTFDPLRLVRPTFRPSSPVLAPEPMLVGP
jgi:hypothetical protein